jgi:hypothetical protein
MMVRVACRPPLRTQFRQRRRKVMNLAEFVLYSVPFDVKCFCCKIFFDENYFSENYIYIYIYIYIYNFLENIFRHLADTKKSPTMSNGIWQHPAAIARFRQAIFLPNCLESGENRRNPANSPNLWKQFIPYLPFFIFSKNKYIFLFFNKFIFFY